MSHKAPLLTAAILTVGVAAAAVVDWTAPVIAPLLTSDRTYIRVAPDNSVWLTGTSMNGSTPPRWDTYVQRLSATGAAVFTMYRQNSRPAGLVLDAEGNAVVAVRNDQSTSGFVTKLAPNGTVRWTFPVAALPAAVAVGGDGAIYVAGMALEDFQPTAGAFKTKIGPAECSPRVGQPIRPCSDAFVAKLRADGSGLVYSTFVGGRLADQATGLAVDPAGAAYITGETVSPDFPTTAGALQTVFGGDVTLGPLSYGDAFVAKLNPAGTALVYSTYLGGDSVELGGSIAVDAQGRAVITGATQSANFPVPPNASQPAYGGGNTFPAAATDVFLVSLNERGERFWATYFGGEGREHGRDIAFGTDGRIYVLVEGATRSVLERRPANPCEGASGVLIVDPATGQPIDSFAPYRLTGTANLEFDRSGLLYLGATNYNPQFGPTSSSVRALRINVGKTNEIAPACILNSATLTPSNMNGADAISPGEIVSIMGERLGPEQGISATADCNGQLPTELGSVRVMVGDRPATLLYVSDRQINAIVPYAIPSGPVQVVVARGATRSEAASLSVAAATPGLFTNPAQPTSVAALNQDGSINSAASPARRGTIVSLFGTGFGLVTPIPAIDLITPIAGPFSVLQQPIEAYSNAGLEILYAGAAPGLAPGVTQLNVRVPSGQGSGLIALKVVVYTRPGEFVSTQAATFLYVTE